MDQAVGVLIVDEPCGLDATFRAELEHDPRLQTVSEADVSRGQGAPANSVALVFLGTDGAASLARLATLKERHPGLAVLVAFESLRADLLSRLVQAGADAFVARSASPRDRHHPRNRSTARRYAFLVCGLLIFALKKSA